MKYHNAPDYLLNPHHKITVALIGCGGTGSQVLSILARFDKSLRALDHLGIHVTVYDDDIVTTANVGRQLFSESEVGQYKSISLVSRINRFFGLNWESKIYQFPSAHNQPDRHNIYISCVDDFDARLKIGKYIKKRSGIHDAESLYWLDFGNTNNSGQVILGSLFDYANIKLECFDSWASTYKKPRKKKSEPSCSLAEALEKQDLLINSSIAQIGMHLLWKLFREGKTQHRGIILNLNTFTTNPILI